MTSLFALIPIPKYSILEKTIRSLLLLTKKNDIVYRNKIEIRYSESDKSNDNGRIRSFIDFTRILMINLQYLDLILLFFIHKLARN